MSSENALLSTRLDAYTVPVVFAAIFVVGVLGNGTLIYTVLRNRVMRNSPNIFLVSLALGDLLLILVSVPFTATTFIFNEWFYGAGMCKLNEFLQTVSLGVSVYTLTALSGDRFVAIVYPMRRHHGHSQKLKTLCIAGGIWVFSVVLGIIELVAARIESHFGFRACIIHPPEWGIVYSRFHTVFRFVVYFALPMGIITAFYCLMARSLWHSGRRIPGDSIRGTASRTRQLESRKKIAKLVLSFIMVFMVCWLPRHIYLIWYYLLPGSYNLFWHIFKTISFCLCFINSCVNPLALYLLSHQFRGYYNRYLCCCCYKSSDTASFEATYSQMHQSRKEVTSIGRNNHTEKSSLRL
ncbi:hypothetical protein CAPTEDRAFT_124159 [Capitella teleta]|uniref:G-protein coupled receptors family 1 profile domain-containing protein n=1 Tax=Capitella teleta TaxID=283909 RepID=R7TSD5_CAPTE|nr:hypothetical protein CAPTEDRAFT_124159 [Capitella teleta]|eukprot:ELT96793.1 hypothetical protein CAPTEDRAFT_124159 [Capitella teleta]